MKYKEPIRSRVAIDGETAAESATKTEFLNLQGRKLGLPPASQVLLKMNN